MAPVLPTADTLPCPKGFKWTTIRDRVHRLYPPNQVFKVTTILGESEVVSGDPILMVHVKRHDHFDLHIPNGFLLGKYIGTLYSLTELENEVYRRTVVARLTR